jgi:hypothetical protein
VRRKPIILFAATICLALFGRQNGAVAGFLDPARSIGPGVSTLFQDDAIGEGTLSGGAGQADDASSPAHASQRNDQLPEFSNRLLPSALAGNQTQQTRGGCSGSSGGLNSGGSSQPAGFSGNLAIPKCELTGQLLLKAVSDCLAPFLDGPFDPPRPR